MTTYASAGNGVNLFYYSDSTKNQKKDFANIHLLDSQYYFFSPIDRENDTEQEKSEKIKSNIYYLAKLEKNKIITEKQFKLYLNKIRDINGFNHFYLSGTADGLYNCVATYIQALGRVERAWEKMDNQTIRLEREVYNNLEDFCKVDDGSFKRYRKKYLKNEPFYSYNISQMFDHIIEKESERKLKVSHYQDEHLKAINNKCKAAIKKLLAKLTLVRTQRLPAEKAAAIRQEWQALRQLALKHNFSEYEDESLLKQHQKIFRFKDFSKEQLLKKYHCIFETDYYDHQNKCLWIQETTQNIVPYDINPDSSFYGWKLDSVYQNVVDNPILRGHFDFFHFEQGFSGKGLYFTPYFYQCVLAGAIGEEAVKAIFKREQISISEDGIEDALFELIDLKIVDTMWYIDAKNYSEQTITHYEITDVDDPLYHPKLNSGYFKKRAKEKLEKIKAYHNNKTNCKIIYINAFGNDGRPIGYFDKDFNSVKNNFAKAEIIVVQAMLKKGKAKKNDRNYASGFNDFISQLKKELNNA